MEARSITYRQASCGFMHFEASFWARVWPACPLPCFSGPSPGVVFPPRSDLAFHIGHWLAVRAHARMLPKPNVREIQSLCLFYARTHECYPPFLKCVRWEDFFPFLAIGIPSIPRPPMVGTVWLVGVSSDCGLPRPGPRCGNRSLRRTPFRCSTRSEEHTSELQSRQYLVCRLLLEKKKKHT